MSREFSKKLLALAKRQREGQQLTDVIRLPSGMILPEVTDDYEPGPLRRRGQAIWSYPVSIVAKVPLECKNFWAESARRYNVPGGQAGLLLEVIEFLREHPAVLAKIVQWRKQAQRSLRKESLCERRKAA